MPSFPALTRWANEFRRLWRLGSGLLGRSEEVSLQRQTSPRATNVTHETCALAAIPLGHEPRANSEGRDQEPNAENENRTP